MHSLFMILILLLVHNGSVKQKSFILYRHEDEGTSLSCFSLSCKVGASSSSVK